jgi:hypothetical protein
MWLSKRVADCACKHCSIIQQQHRQCSAILYSQAQYALDSNMQCIADCPPESLFPARWQPDGATLFL